MKKLVCVLATLVLAANTISTSMVDILALNPTTNTSVTNSNSVAIKPSGTCYGRLIIESANIDVALYKGSSQTTCDAADSACFFRPSYAQGMIIADHNYQSFSTLTNVTVGTQAVIEEENGAIIHLECVEVADGRNIRRNLVYNDGTTAISNNDYLTYTCLDNNGNIRICQWTITSAEDINSSYEYSFNVDSNTISNLEQALITSN